MDQKSSCNIVYTMIIMKNTNAMSVRSIWMRMR